MQTEHNNTVKKEDASQKPNKIKIFFSYIGWIILWPIIVFLPFLGTVFIGRYISKELLFKYVGDHGQQYYSYDVGLAIGVSLLVIILLLIKKDILKKNEPSYINRGKVLGVYIWLGVFLTFFLLVTSRNQEVLKLPVFQDPEIISTFSSIGGDPKKAQDVSFMYVDALKYEDMFGSYQAHTNDYGVIFFGIIQVKKGLNDNDKKVTVAHEYLHHIWNTQISSEDKRILTSQLIELYANDYDFRHMHSNYYKNNQLDPSELFSIYCTWHSDRFLTEFVLSQCNKYIDRNALTFAR